MWVKLFVSVLYLYIQLFAYFFTLVIIFGQSVELRYLTCWSCTASKQHCYNTCRGHYCFKAELISRDSPTKNLGCLNETDTGITINECADDPDVLPYSGTRLKERLCVCTHDYCNSSGRYHPSLTTPIIVISILLLLYCAR